MDRREQIAAAWASARGLILLAGLALAAFLLVYLLAVQTELGQRADEAALAGGRQTPEGARDAADDLLRVLSIGSLLAATAVLSGLAWLRRRPGLLLIPAAVIGLSLLATEAFKLVIFERPDLLVDSELPGNSYPSGHTTVAAGIGLAALLIAPPRLRGKLAFGAAALAATAGVFVVTADWHRPSDPIGSFLLTLSVAAAAMAALRLWRPGRATRVHRTAGGRDAARLELTAMLAGALVFVGTIVAGSLRYGAEVDWNRFHLAYLLAAAAIVVVAGLTVAGLLRALEPPASAPRNRIRDRSQVASWLRGQYAGEGREQIGPLKRSGVTDERRAGQDGRDGDGGAGELRRGEPAGVGRRGDRAG